MGLSCRGNITDFDLISAFSLSIDFIFAQVWDWKEVKSSLSVDVITILIVGPLTLGGYCLALHIIREKEARIGHIFRWFTEGSKFIKSFLLYIVVNIYLFLWFLLFIIPGIIKSFSYAMTYFIINDHPEIL